MVVVGSIWNIDNKSNNLENVAYKLILQNEGSDWLTSISWANESSLTIMVFWGVTTHILLYVGGTDESVHYPFVEVDHMT